MTNRSLNALSLKRPGIILSCLLLYWSMLFLLHFYFNIAPLPLVILPVVASCWHFGTKRGLLAGAFLVLSSLFLIGYFHFHRGNPIQGLLAVGMSLILGTGAGWVRKLYDKEKKHSAALAAERTALLREIEERTRAEKRALWDEYLLKAMGNSSNLGVIAINSNSDEILYSNRRLCEMWNIEEFEDRIAARKMKCSELLRHCLSLVDNKELTEENFSFTSDSDFPDAAVFRLKDGRTLRSISTRIQGRNMEYLGLLFVFEDITDTIRSEDLLKRRYDYEHLIYTISNLFVNAPADKMDEAFNASLKAAGEFLGMDLGFFFRASKESAAAVNLFEWRSDGANESLSRVPFVEAGILPSFEQMLKDFEKVAVPNAAELPDNFKMERDFLLKRNLNALILIPVIVEHSIAGLIGFCSHTPKEFHEDASEMLKILSDIFASAFKRRMKHEALLASEERSRLLVQNSADLITVIESDGTIKYTSQAVKRMLGYDPAERISKPIIQFVHPEEQFILKEVISSLKDNEGAVMGPYYLRVSHSDGSYKHLEVIFTGQLNNPAINGIIMNSRDFSQHIVLQEALRNSRNFLNAVINNAADPMFVVDSSHKWVIVNDAYCRLTGFKREEMLGKTAYDIFSKEVADTAFEHEEKILNGEGTNDYYSLFTSAKNKKLWVAVHKSIYEEETGEKFIIANLRDETSRKELEEEVKNALMREKELNRLKSRFISMVSHEYRTPLTAILSAAELLELFGVDMIHEERLEYIDDIKRSVDYLTSLLNDVLLINRSESGHLEFEPSSFDLIPFCMEMVKYAMEGAKCKIEVNADPSAAKVYMDKKLLRHILLNLLSNAVKYSYEGGTVRFNIICKGERTDFEIVDNGIGIPPEDQKHLFQPFFRAENVSNVPGSGLGLPIVKYCTELHNGTVSFESSPGKGTKFVISIPSGNNSTENIGEEGQEP